jgi:hypothetical protein
MLNSFTAWKMCWMSTSVPLPALPNACLPHFRSEKCGCSIKQIASTFQEIFQALGSQLAKDARGRKTLIRIHVIYRMSGHWMTGQLSLFTGFHGQREISQRRR